MKNLFTFIALLTLGIVSLYNLTARASSFDKSFGGAVAADLDTTGVIMPKFNQTGGSLVSLIRNSYNPLTGFASGYRQLLSPTSDDVNHLYIYDSSGKVMTIAVGAPGSEVDTLYIPPNSTLNKFDVFIPKGSRISVKGISGDATSGELNMTLMK